MVAYNCLYWCWLYYIDYYLCSASVSTKMLLPNRADPSAQQLPNRADASAAAQRLSCPKRHPRQWQSRIHRLVVKLSDRFHTLRIPRPACSDEQRPLAPFQESSKVARASTESKALQKRSEPEHNLLFIVVLVVLYGCILLFIFVLVGLY